MRNKILFDVNLSNPLCNVIAKHFDRLGIHASYNTKTFVIDATDRNRRAVERLLIMTGIELYIEFDAAGTMTQVTREGKKVRIAA